MPPRTIHPHTCLAPAVAGAEATHVQLLVLDAYQAARGLPPWRRASPPGTILTAAAVNEAISWWNAWQAGHAG